MRNIIFSKLWPYLTIIPVALAVATWPEEAFLSIMAMLIGVCVVFVIIRRSDFGVILALVTAGLLADLLRRFSVFGSGSSDVRLAGLVGLGLLCVTVCSVLLEHFLRKRRIRIVCMPLPLLFLLGFVAVNLLAVGYGGLRYGLSRALPDADWIFWIGFFFLIALKPSLRLMKYLVICLMALSLIQSLQGIWRLIQGQGTIFLTTGGERYVSGSASLFIASGLIASLILLIFVARTGYQKRTYASFAFIQAVGVVLSFNRQTWLALTVSFLCAFFLFFGRKRWQVVWVVTVTAVVLVSAIVTLDSAQVFSVRIQDLLIRRVSGGSFQELQLDPSYQFRISSWSTAIDGTLNRPILGNGWGAPFRFSIVVPRTGEVQVFDSSPHNVYLWLAYKSGIFSLLFLICFVVILLLQAIQKWRLLNRNRSIMAYYLMGSILIHIVYFTGAFFWDYFSVMYMSIPIWINTGVLAALTSYRVPNNDTY